MNTQLTSHPDRADDRSPTTRRRSGSPSLFAYTQTISSTNSDAGRRHRDLQQRRGRRRLPGLGHRAGERVPAHVQFTSPTSADTVTIDGQQISLAAGASRPGPRQRNQLQPERHRLGDGHQASPNGGPATVVLSDRATGAPDATGDFINVSDPGGALTEQTQYAQAGVDAQYTINGGAGAVLVVEHDQRRRRRRDTPNSTTGQGATQTIPGVSLSLNGVTGSTPVTVTVGVAGAEHAEHPDRDAAVRHRLQLRDHDDPDTAHPGAIELATRRRGPCSATRTSSSCSRTCASRWTRPSAA